MKQDAAIDYRGQYDRYWSSPDRIGESSGDLDRIAEQIAATFGLGTVLDAGSGEGALIAALLRRGIDARGLDVSQVVVDRANRRMPGRFAAGSILRLPFPDASFDTVVSTDCLEHLAPRDVAAALGEMRRVARRNVFIVVATTGDRDQHWHLTVEGRDWWESRCFEAGLRKHPAYYRVNDYESLDREQWQIAIALEKLPAAAAARHPLAQLAAERDLHMDMLRETGERSDAHVVRYQWAGGYVRSGDRVLDAACGLGYGAHVIRRLTRAASVLGIDGSDSAVAYAEACYGEKGRVEFRRGLLPQALAALADASFDAIVSFETLEHLEDPRALLAEFSRLLTPGGRAIVSVPNDWSDETGRDPSPHHLQVYDWKRLSAEIGEHFIAEDAYAQTASRCKVAGGRAWQRRGRSLARLDPAAGTPPESEWCLLVAMKSPLGAAVPYEERAYANLAGTRHPSVRHADFYDNPWLANAMVNIELRLKSRRALDELSAQVAGAARPESNDRAAALCVSGYGLLEQALPDGDAIGRTLAAIEGALAKPPRDALALRWRVSLLFLEARLLQVSGRLGEAADAFDECARHDVRGFGIHLATKTTEAWFAAGRLALALADRARARRAWASGLQGGVQLLAVSLDDIVINPDAPNLFNHGDGIREYELAWDNVARCANGLHLLARGDDVDVAMLDASFQREYAVVTRDLAESRQEMARGSRDLLALRASLVELRQTLTERTEALDRSAADLVVRTRELEERRSELEERTRELEERTRELVELRAALAERTGALDRSAADLVERTRELVATRETLAERTARLEEAVRALEEARKAPFAHALRVVLGRLRAPGAGTTQ